MLEEVDSEDMQNPMTSPSDFVVLLVTTIIENVGKKSQHESNLLGKFVVFKSLWQFLQTS
jgi:hypothetical protein